ncbi:MAG: Lipopolysaccharide assembly protein A [SAR92 bacterium MED-G29]|jgi:putative membrane protein|nr:lipopolysaccharide assembly protein LapA domain-containing protein [Porticoccaceae bacterium]CAI8287382.1 MAG: Lipopolysaccharide assembly protein A [SAR92 bacterium MED-G29]|tara:strand:- start:2419 stop:2694 length:276 start_codon:yes stop_codon:yes gene_type:complete
MPNSMMEANVRALWLFVQFILVVAIALMGALFAMENSQLVTVNFVVFSSPAISLGLWLLLFLATGTILGIITSSLIIGSYRRKLRRALKKD